MPICGPIMPVGGTNDCGGPIMPPVIIGGGMPVIIGFDMPVIIGFIGAGMAPGGPDIAKGLPGGVITPDVGGKLPVKFVDVPKGFPFGYMSVPDWAAHCRLAWRRCRLAALVKCLT
mmetsp:Transcript_4299/g.7158  ORF Transcript_4299/g.7158 Transcript_4299/m.7158 type:complete len:116 (-) Transcript_4299:27-374(-)